MDNLLSEIISNKIQKTDDDGTLCIYCAKDPINEFQKSIRGTIFEGDTMIYRGFPYTEELTQHDIGKIKQYELEKLRACWSYEGTLLKFLHHPTRGWYITTHRKLDAFQSRWVSRKTFGELFKDALLKYDLDYDNFLSLLDITKRYHFILLSNSDTRIVTRPEFNEELMYLVLYTDSNDVPIWPLESIGKIPITQELKLKDAQEIVDTVAKINPFQLQGIIFYSNDFKKQYRVLNSKYREFANVRNNIASLKYCYILARRDEHQKKLFLELYPEAIEIVKCFEARIHVLAEEIFSVYKRRYIQKQFVRVSKERHAVLQALHSRYFANTPTEITKFKHDSAIKLTNRVPIKIDDVIHILNTFPNPNKIYKMINLNETFLSEK